MITLHTQTLGSQPYESTWQAMREFTDLRDANSNDEIWLVEHPPVYTQGQAGKVEHLLSDTNIPVIQSDRGGQITYHGPGQLIAYCLLDVKRLGLGPKGLVCKIEQATIGLLNDYGIVGKCRDGAPGIYVNDAKIASVGLRIRHGRSYHGLALNVDMDLGPFAGINTCGMPELAVTQMRDLGFAGKIEDLHGPLVAYLGTHLGYNTTS